jgi:hypothetical protein
MGWLRRRLDAKQVGSSGAASRDITRGVKFHLQIRLKNSTTAKAKFHRKTKSTCKYIPQTPDTPDPRPQAPRPSRGLGSREQGARARAGPLKKKGKGTKKEPKQKATDRLPFFVLCSFFLFCGLSAKRQRIGCGLRTCHQCHRPHVVTRTRSRPVAGCGVFLYELVPSDDPFIWSLCGGGGGRWRPFFYPTAIFLISSEK